MNFEYVKDENGKVVDIIVDGKPVKRGYLRGFKKAQDTSYWRFCVQGTGINPYSGVSVELNALELTIYNFCRNWYNRYNVPGKDTECPVQTFDDMKYFFLSLNSQAYMDLLD